MCFKVIRISFTFIILLSQGCATNPKSEILSLDSWLPKNYEECRSKEGELSQTFFRKKCIFEYINTSFNTEYANKTDLICKGRETSWYPFSTDSREISEFGMVKGCKIEYFD